MLGFRLLCMRLDQVCQCVCCTYKTTSTKALGRMRRSKTGPTLIWFESKMLYITFPDDTRVQPVNSLELSEEPTPYFFHNTQFWKIIPLWCHKGSRYHFQVTDDPFGQVFVQSRSFSSKLKSELLAAVIRGVKCGFLLRPEKFALKRKKRKKGRKWKQDECHE